MKKRLIFNSLLEQQNSNKISILLGARQVGKTTLLKALYNELSKTNQAIFLDLDIYSNYEKVSSLDMFLNTLKLSSYQEKQSQMFYVFLDEFQQYDDLTKILKNIYDNYPNIKIYASGSSSLTIKDRIQESLAGRKIITYIYPLNFREFLFFKDREDLLQKMDNLRNIQTNEASKLISELNILLEEFFIYGGYPEVVLSKNNAQKQQYLTSVFDLYVRKDLIDYLKIERVNSVKEIIQYLAVNHGKEINYANIAQITHLSINTIKSYLAILQETYIILIIKPFFKNKNKEIVKSPKIYFLDNGVRNFFINNFNPPKIRDDTPFLFEEFVITELIKNDINPLSIKFWRTKKGDEVDIIIDNISQLIPIEVKYKYKTKSEDYNGLKEFMLNYPNTKKPFLINLESNNSINNDIQLLLPFDIAEKIKI